MADFLTHLFLPLTAAYVLKPELFDSSRYFLLGGFGLLADFDKFLGQPGLLHSLLILGPICLGILGVERLRGNQLGYASVVVAIILSHLVLDFVDGGPVPLLFPLVEAGFGLEYPIRTVFGEGLLGVSFHGPLVDIRVASPRQGFNTYGFIQGLGVANALLFAVIFVGQTMGPRDGN